MMNNLNCMYDTRASFYGKAKIETIGDIKILKSYDTDVAQITKNKNNIVYRYFGKFSQTTTRHQKEFFKQNGLNDDEIKELFKIGKLIKESEEA